MSDGRICPECLGTGEVEAGHFNNNGEYVFDGYQTCRRCEGRGQLGEAIEMPEEDSDRTEKSPPDEEGLAPH
jgi:DnaJ-class molecular chaperone